MKEIVLKFKNFKLLKDTEISLKDSYLYFVKGSNGKGKTSFKNGIELLCTAKNNIDNPISFGEESCSIEGINIPGADGREYIVKWDFDGDKNKFIVIDDEGKKISAVEKIRDIFKFKSLSVEDFMAQSLNAKGREEQKKLFMSFLTDEEQRKHSYAKAKEKEAYDARTKAKIELEYLVGICADSKVTKDEQSLVDASEKAQATFNDLEAQIKSFDDIRATKQLKNERRKQVGENVVILTTEIEDYKQQIFKLEAKIKEKELAKKALEEEFKTFKADAIDEEKETEVRARYEKGKEVMSKIAIAKGKKIKFDENDVKRNAKLLEWNTLDGNVKKYRTDADDIIKNSKMPIENIEFEDDGIKIDGLSIKENQISKAKCMLIVAEILCKLNDAPIMLIGSASDLDNASRAAMEELGRKYDKILISDEVELKDSDIHVVGFDESSNNN